MKLEGTSKTKESKFNATVSFIVSIAMLVIVFVGFDFSTMPAFGKIFMVVWVFIVVAQGYQAFRNSIFSDNSLHHEVTDHQLQIKGNVANSQQGTQKCHAEKLRKVEQLYKDGLLSQEEYLAKRKDILDEDWGR